MRDYAIETTFDLKFTTRAFATGVPTTLAGTPAIAAYPDNSTTEITAGITLTVDFDSRTGLHNVRVVATVANGYAAGSNYALVITAGTVDGTSVVGEVIGEFSLEAQSPLRPTVAGRELDVSAGGEAGLDWANIGSPTTAQNLSATNIDTDQVVASVTGAVGSVTGNVGGNVAGDVQGNVDGSVGSVATGGISAASFAAGAIDAAALAADAATEIATAVWAAGTRTLTSFGSLIADIWANATRTLTSLAGNAADIRAAVGLAAADLDTQLGGIASDAGTAATEATAAATDAAAILVLTTASLDATISSRATPADVNAQVLDVLNVDTFGEPTGVPPATTTLQRKLSQVYMALRNGLTVTATDKTFLDDGAAAEWKKPLSDDGTTYTEGEGTTP